MGRIRAPEVGGTPVLQETVTQTPIDNRIPTGNSKTEMHCQSKSPKNLTKGSGTTAGSFRRSARISNRLSDTPLTPDNCAEVGHSSVMATDNVDTETLVDNAEGQETPGNKDNVTNSSRGRDSGSSKGRGRGRGKHKSSGTNVDIQDAHIVGTGRVSRGGRGKGKRKLNPGTFREVKFSSDESDEKEIKSSDDEYDNNFAKVLHSSGMVTDNVEAGSLVDNVEGLETPVNKDNVTIFSRGRDNGSSCGRERGRGKCKSSGTNGDIKEAHTVGTARRSRGGRGKWKRKLNLGIPRKGKFSENESDEKEIESSEGHCQDKEITSTAEYHTGDGVHCIAEAVDLVGGDVQENAQQNQSQSHNNRAAEQDVMGVDVAPENHNQNYNSRVAEHNGMGENVAPENHSQNQDNRDAEQNLMQETAAPQNQNQNQNQNQDYRVSARDRFRGIARRRAAHFAFFDPEKEQPSTSEQRPDPDIEGKSDEERIDWPGPFSTARRLVEERAAALAARQEKLAGGEKSASLIEWEPTREKDFKIQTIPPPLEELCLSVLCKHIDFIESLEGIPDATKNKICRAFCASRKATSQVLRMFLTGSQTEIRVTDCSLVSEADLTELMAQCSTTNLEVLQLGMCGRGLTDRLLQATIACPSVGLPCLTHLSLNGAYRLSDVGLMALVQAAPSLSSLDLSQCSYLSEASINTLADHLAPVLRELRLEECQQLEALKILPALKKMHKLEVLSVAGIPSVTDEFVTETLAYLGCDLRELSFADCGKLTDGALEAIGAVCCALNVLILDNLNLLTDTSLVYLTNGCRSLKTLSLKRCMFSDKAVAAFIGGSGNYLSNLSLNSVKRVENHTILALVSNASENLSRLDASWCRKLTDEALGLLADSCPYLQELILFGCTQVTDKFLKGHSNNLLKVIGV